MASWERQLSAAEDAAPVGTLTSDDELPEVGDGGSQRGEGDAAVEVLLAALRLHMEGRHQPLVAQVRQGRSVEHGAVPPLRRPQTRPQAEGSAKETRPQTVF